MNPCENYVMWWFEVMIWRRRFLIQSCPKILPLSWSIISYYRQIWHPEQPVSFIVSSIVGGVNEKTIALWIFEPSARTRAWHLALLHSFLNPLRPTVEYWLIPIDRNWTNSGRVIVLTHIPSIYTSCVERNIKKGREVVDVGENESEIKQNLLADPGNLRPQSSTMKF